MLETFKFFARVATVVAIAIAALSLATCRPAHADALADLGVMCIQGNAGACSIYQSAIAQQMAQEQLYQQGINNLTGYLTTQQYLANQRMQQTPRATFCTQQGVFVVCQ